MPDKALISRKKFIRLGAMVGPGVATVPFLSARGDGGTRTAGGVSGGGIEGR